MAAFDPDSATPSVQHELGGLISAIVNRTDHAQVNAAERAFKMRLQALGCDDSYIHGAINYAWIQGKAPPQE